MKLTNILFVMNMLQYALTMHASRVQTPNSLAVRPLTKSTIPFVREENHRDIAIACTETVFALTLFRFPIIQIRSQESWTAEETREGIA